VEARGIEVARLEAFWAARVAKEIARSDDREPRIASGRPDRSGRPGLRDDRNYWQQVEGYVSAHPNAQLSHGICPQCYEQILAPQLRAMREARGERARDA